MITIERELAQAAAAALHQAGDHASAEAFERKLNPPKLWVLRGPLGEDGLYRTYLGREHAFGTSEYGPSWYCFGSGADAVIFTEAEKNALDHDQVLAEWTDFEEPGQEDEVREQLMLQTRWEEAPSAEDGHDAFASGSTELDFCEALTALGERADRLREQG